MSKNQIAKLCAAFIYIPSTLLKSRQKSEEKNKAAQERLRQLLQNSASISSTLN